MTTEPSNPRSEPAGGGGAGDPFNAADDGAHSGQPSAQRSEQAAGQRSEQPAERPSGSNEVRDIAEVPAVEVITAAAVHLMSAAAVKCGLAEDAEPDLDEARKLITVLAALVTAAAPEIGGQHAAPLRDGLKTLQLAFREASTVPDAAGQGPGERWTGPVA